LNWCLKFTFAANERGENIQKKRFKKEKQIRRTAEIFLAFDPPVGNSGRYFESAKI
jgi:hypothetical protein